MNEGLHKVISGGQVGVDMAALRAARYLGLETGGTAPPDYMTSDGPKHETLRAYGLKELGSPGGAAGYIARSQRNVNDAQATIAFRSHSSAGTDKTIQFCINGRWRTPTLAMGDVDACVFASPGCHRPLLVVRRMTLATQEAVRAFLRQHQVVTLNVAGHRKVDGEPGWEDAVEAFLIKAMSKE